MKNKTAGKDAKAGKLVAVRMGKSGPLERAQLANQIQGFRIPDRSDAWENNKHWYQLAQLRSDSKSRNEIKHHCLTEIISFIVERVPSETDKIYSFSWYHGYLNSLRVFLYNLTRFNALTWDSFGCGYDVVPLIGTIIGWNKRASVLCKQQMIFIVPS